MHEGIVDQIGMPNDDIFNLVKSLTTNEKKFFKHYAERQKGSKVYKTLFLVLDEMVDYDPDFVASQFSGQLHVTKKYLFDEILKSLQFKNKTIQDELQASLANIDRLYRIGLYLKMHQYIKRAKKIALAHEEFELYLLLLNKEELYFTRKEAKKRQQLLLSVQDERERVLTILFNIQAVKRVYTQLYLFIKDKHIASTPEDDQKLADLLDNDCLLEETLLSDTARIYAISCEIIKHRMRQEHKEEYELSRKLMIIFSNHSELCRTHQHRYVAELIKFFQACFQKNQFEEALKTYVELQQIPDKGLNEKLQIFTYASPALLQYYLGVKKDLKEGIPILRKLEKEYEVFRAHLNIESRALFLVNVMMKNMELKDYSMAKTHSFELMSFPKNRIRKDIGRMHRIVSLLMYFESKDWSALLSRAQSVYDVVRKQRKDLPKWEWEMVRFFYRLPDTPTDKPKVRKLLVELHEKITELQKEEYEERTMRTFNFPTWILVELKNWK